MICRVKYIKEPYDYYCGPDYTYITDLPLRRYDKVIAPVGDKGETKRAIVNQIDLPDSCIDPSWADRVKKITEYDKL